MSLGSSNVPQSVSGPARLMRAPAGSFLHAESGILGSALQMTSRLRDHIERLDNGVVYAADDLAVVLRALLVESQGNRVLRRMFEALSIPCPDILLSQKPATGDKVQFSVGSIPTREVGSLGDGATRVSLKRWPRTPVIVVALGGDQRTFTWEKFLNEYANKWGGAHLDIVVPPHLQYIDYYAVGGLVLTSYLLRSAAVEVWLLAQHALRLGLTQMGVKVPVGGQGEEPYYSADGGVGTLPRDIGSRGNLQWFYHSSDSSGMLWYVDGESPNNALHLTFGKMSYDVSYTPPFMTPSNQAAPAAFQAPRHRRKEQQVTVERDELKSLTFEGRIRTLAEVRASAQEQHAG